MRVITNRSEIAVCAAPDGVAANATEDAVTVTLSFARMSFTEYIVL